MPMYQTFPLTQGEAVIQLWPSPWYRSWIFIFSKDIKKPMKSLFCFSLKAIYCVILRQNVLYSSLALFAKLGCGSHFAQKTNNFAKMFCCAIVDLILVQKFGTYYIKIITVIFFRYHQYLTKRWIFKKFRLEFHKLTSISHIKFVPEFSLREFRWQKLTVLKKPGRRSLTTANSFLDCSTSWI